MAEEKLNKKVRIVLIFVVIMLIPTIWFQFLNKGSDKEIASKALTGEWLRSDGNYTIEIKEVRDKNLLVAFYLNPNPINVARSTWRLEDDVLEIYMEMNDVNYQGSNYKLTYDEQTDRLVGFYYQATLQQTYDVIFNKQ